MLFIQSIVIAPNRIIRYTSGRPQACSLGPCDHFLERDHLIPYKNMIIRVQSEHGTKRFEVSESDHIAKLFELTAKAFNLDPSSEWQLSKSRKGVDAIRRNSRLMLRSAKLQ